MATDESAFKQEVKDSIVSTYPDKFVWCPADKFASGVTDLHVIIDRFYGIEAKFCKALPKRGSSVILKHPFTSTQVRFMDRLNKTKAAVGCGLIWLGKDSALVLHPSQIDSEGNLTKDDAEKYWEKQHILKSNCWDITKLLEITRSWNG